MVKRLKQINRLVLKENTDTEKIEVWSPDGRLLEEFERLESAEEWAQDFDRTFKIGDEVEYDSYNMKYTGKILRIGEKTVLVDASSTGSGRCSLTIYGFVNKNWNFDAEKIAADNLQTSYCI